MSASGPAGTGSLAQELITVTLRSMAAGSIEKEPVKKKVPGSFQVAKVKQLCKRLFDLGESASRSQHLDKVNGNSHFHEEPEHSLNRCAGRLGHDPFI